MVEEQREYWAFICYRHLDNIEEGREWATWIAREIETYEVPADLVGTKSGRGDEIPERLYPVFRDEDELSADADLSSPIYAALRNTKTLVVICSPRALTSRYVGNEISFFKSLGRSDRVLAMMIEGEPYDPDRDCFPEAIKHPVDEQGEIDRSDDVEPVAADFRLPNGNQGWTTLAECRKHIPGERAVRKYRERCELAKLKVIAGILGLPLGTLIERDKAYQLELARKRARIFTSVAVAMTLLALFAVAAGIFAWVKRNEAARQREVALQTRDSAEGLIGEILFNLGGKLEPIGRLDLLDDVSIAAENYFEHLPSEQVDPRSERNRSVMLDSRARVLEAAGDLEGALERYREGLSIARKLREEDPDDPMLKHDEVLSLKNVADTLQDQNRSSEARPLYEEGVLLIQEAIVQVLGEGGFDALCRSILREEKTGEASLARRTMEENPGIISLMATAAVLQERLGDAVSSRGDFEEALEFYEAAVYIQSALFRFDPSSRSVKDSLAAAHDAIGNLEIQRTNYAKARTAFEKVVKLARENLPDAPTDVGWQEILAGGLGRLGVVAYLEGDYKEYYRYALEALELFREIAKNDPGNRVRQRNLYVGLTQVALAERALGNHEASRAHFSEAGEIVLKLIESDETNGVWRQDYATNLEYQAAALREEKDYKGALRVSLSAIEQHRRLFEGYTDNLVYRRNLLLAINWAAIDCWTMKRFDEAVGYFTESATLGESIVADLAEPTVNSFQDLSKIYLFLGQVEQERERLPRAVEWYEKAFTVANKAYESGVIWDGLTEESLQKARSDIDEVAKKAEGRQEDSPE